MRVHLVLAAALCALPLPAQVASAALLGRVRDESGAVAPEVRVTARHQSTGFIRSVVTGGDGTYRIDELMPGAYTILAEKPGFQTLTVEPVRLEVNHKAALDLILRVGARRDSVTVTAAVSPVDAHDASSGYRTDQTAARGLPLDGRNVVSLVTLGAAAVPRHLGGFTHDVVNDVQEARGAVALNPPIHGARSTMNVFLLDGALNTDRNTSAIAVIPPLESIQEFRIQTSLAPAEFAQAGGGVVDMVTKSGGRSLHGSAFEFFRNEAADARNFFDDPALPRPIFRQNQFGGSAGGPFPLPDTFFFATYEGLRGKSAKSSLNIVPDEAVRQGDFRGRNPIFDPLTTDPVTGARRPFPNNTIPPGRIDPIARRFLERFEPLPNRQGTSNYLDATPSENAADHASGRLDRQFRSRGLLFGRYTLNEERNRLAGVFPELPTRERVRAQQAAVGHTFGAGSWVHEARFSFTRLKVFELPETALRANVARELGIADASDDPLDFGLPFFLVTNFSMVTDTPNRPQLQRDHLWHASDGFTAARGAHTWKLGGQWTRFRMNYLQSRLSRGQYIFTGAFTGDPANPDATGDAFADFLLGFPQFTNRNAGSAQADLVQHGYAAYVQDEWRLGRLSLSLGVRYEYVTPFQETRGRLLNLDYSPLPRPPALVAARRGARPDRNNWAPRAGLAWQPAVRRNLVLRAGYGVYFNPEIAVESYDLVRNGIRNESNATDGLRPLLTLREGFPRTATTGLPGYFGLDAGARTPYMQQWTAGWQFSPGGGVVLEAAYIGSKGTKLGRFRNFNTPLRVETGENLPPRPGELQSLRPFPELGKIVQRQHISNSSYHALEIKAERRFAGRLGFLASLVWSKSIDDADSVIPGLFDSVGAQDERNLRLERGLSFFDVGRRISGGMVYDLPGRGPAGLLSGWRLSGILTLQDGTPLNVVYFAYDGANTGTPNRPDVVSGQSIRLPRSERTADRFFNTNAFATPRPFSFGNAGRNILPGPGNAVLDLALHRRFGLGERRTFELRVEAFNLLNHPNFGIPGPYPDFGPFFGKIFSTGPPRRLQIGSRLDF